MGRSKQIAAEITAALARGSVHPEATPSDWKKLIADIKKRFQAASNQQQRDVLQEEYKAAQLGLRASSQVAAGKSTYLTDTNLVALKEMVLAQGPEFSSRVSSVDAPHIKRCVAAGLVEVDGSRARLTPAGREAIADEIVRDIQREESWTPKENPFVPSSEKRAELLKKDVADHDLKLRRLEQTLTKLK